MTGTTSAIGASEELGAIEREINMSSVPDMFFAGSFLRVSWNDCEIYMNSKSALKGSLISPSDADLRWKYDTPPVLCDPSVRKDLLGKLAVKHSSVWSAGVRNHPLTKFTHSHDWTYTTTYWGSIQFSSKSPKVSVSSGSDCREDFLPWETLKDTSTPVSFFKEVHLWEDELSDNGFSKMSVKIRFMDWFFYILLKYDLRVDGVVDSRSLETRIFHELGSNNILREFRWVENGKELGELQSQEVLIFSS